MSVSYTHLDVYKRQPYMMDNANTNGYNDFTYKKIDLLAASEVFGKDPLVIYFKAVCDRKRKNPQGFLSLIHI